MQRRKSFHFHLEKDKGHHSNKLAAGNFPVCVSFAKSSLKWGLALLVRPGSCLRVGPETLVFFFLWRLKRSKEKAVWDIFFFVSMLSLSLHLLEFFRHIALQRKLSRLSACWKIEKAELRDRPEAAGTTASSRSGGGCTRGTGLSGGRQKPRAAQVPSWVSHFLNKWEVSQL